MINKNVATIALVAVIVGGAAFFGGTKYAESKNPQGARAQGNFQNIGGGQTGGAGRMMGRGQNGANFAGGQIIAKDDKSVTVKLSNGGSKIIFYSASTKVEKFTEGTANDLAVGSTIAANGNANQDGSITAQSIQLRPQSINPSTTPNP